MVKILLSSLVFVNFYLFNLLSDDLQKQSEKFYEAYSVIRYENTSYESVKQKLREIISIKPDNFISINAAIFLVDWKNYSDISKGINKYDILKFDLCNIYLLSKNKSFDEAGKTLLQIKEDFPDINVELLNSIYEDLKSFDDSESSLKLFNEKFIALKDETAPYPLNLSQTRSEIIYPDEAREKKIEGSVKIKLLISADGDVIKTGDFEGNMVFKDVVTKAASKLKFTPAMFFGSPVICWITVPYNFTLKKNE